MTTQARTDILNPDRRQLLSQAAMTAVAASVSSLLPLHSAQGRRERSSSPVPRQRARARICSTCAAASRRRGGRSGRPSPINRRACSSRRCRSSRSYWATDYDWRKVRGATQRAAAIRHRDRRARHPFHPRALEARECAADHRHARLARLDHRAAEDHRPAHQSHRARRERGGRLRRRDSVAAGLRVFRQADRDRLGPHPHRPRLDRADEAPRLHAVRGAGRRLGQRRHGADGAAGAAGVARHPHQHAGHRSGRHRQGASPAAARRRASRPTSSTRTTSSTSSTSTAWATPRRWRTARRRCTGSRIRRSASPPGCSTTTRAATRSSRASSTARPKGLTRDDILDNITLYWLTNTAVSSARLYWESKLAFFAPKGVTIPVAVSVFPDEIYAGPAELGGDGPIPSSSTTTGSTRAATSRPGSSPQLFCAEMRAAFRSLRQSI